MDYRHKPSGGGQDWTRKGGRNWKRFDWVGFCGSELSRMSLALLSLRGRLSCRGMARRAFQRDPVTLSGLPDPRQPMRERAPSRLTFVAEIAALTDTRESPRVRASSASR